MIFPFSPVPNNFSEQHMLKSFGINYKFFSGRDSCLSDRSLKLTTGAQFHNLNAVETTLV